MGVSRGSVIPIKKRINPSPKSASLGRTNPNWAQVSPLRKITYIVTVMVLTELIDK
jgi:hypothetical protein